MHVALSAELLFDLCVRGVVIADIVLISSRASSLSQRASSSLHSGQRRVPGRDNKLYEGHADIRRS